MGLLQRLAWIQKQGLPRVQRERKKKRERRKMKRTLTSTTMTTMASLLSMPLIPDPYLRASQFNTRTRHTHQSILCLVTA